jgi:hypothetical protein
MTDYFREALQFALKYTPSNNINNIRKVLALLIPVEVLAIYFLK